MDSARESNGKKKGEGNTKNGNKYLAWAFVEGANFALRYCPGAKRFYKRKKRKTNGIVAIKAVAHKLARACYHIPARVETLRREAMFRVTGLPEPLGEGASTVREAPISTGARFACV